MSDIIRLEDSLASARRIAGQLEAIADAEARRAAATGRPEHAEIAEEHARKAEAHRGVIERLEWDLESLRSQP